MRIERIYKCRLCQRVLYQESISNGASDTIEFLLRVAREEKPVSIHGCSEGISGISELIGARKMDLPAEALLEVIGEEEAFKELSQLRGFYNESAVGMSPKERFAFEYEQEWPKETSP